MIGMKTLVCADGVMGLNGWQYLFNDDRDYILHDTEKEANDFLMGHGYKQEYIDENITFFDFEGEFPSACEACDEPMSEDSYAQGQGYCDSCQEDC